jgi:heat shock protein HslJ
MDAPRRTQAVHFVEGRMVAKNWCRGLAAAVMMLVQPVVTAHAQQNEFPFESELLLDARPMPGSKRIPNMDVAANGTIALEMWCNRVDGQVVVAGDTITVIIGQPTERSCSPERARGDADLLEALNGMTNWHRQGDAVVLVGPKTLRFKVPTN